MLENHSNTGSQEPLPTSAPVAPDTERVRALIARHARGLRIAALILAGLAAFGILVAVAYQLALARVPQHRAVLEQLVRVQTGLDVHFNELTLEWGWYGPEVVFRGVELGEPGRSNVLLRAPQLIVSFDAWRTLRSGQLQAGRVRLVAPEIDLARLQPPDPESAVSRQPRTPAERRARILQRWRDGRIEVEGGTIRLPEPGGSANVLSLQIRRASLRRAGDQWSASALLFLPERLGRVANVSARVEGDLGKPDTLSGNLRFTGQRLAFASWRELLSSSMAVARHLPTAGGGDVTMRVEFAEGSITSAEGNIRADGVTLTGPWWKDDSAPQDAANRNLQLGYLRGDWRLKRNGPTWSVRVDEFQVGPRDDATTGSALSLDIDTNYRRVQGGLGAATVQSLLAFTRWLAPQLDFAGAELRGAARDITFGWDAARAAGERLNVSARLENLSLAPPSRSFSLTGLDVQVSGGESELTAQIESAGARLQLASLPDRPLTDLRITSRVQVSHTGSGWRLASDELDIVHAGGRLSLGGTLQAESAQSTPRVAVNGTFEQADIAILKELLGESVSRIFGTTAARLTAGRIEDARFTLSGVVDALPFGEDQQSFTGSLTLREGTLAAEGAWPAVERLNARLDWTGAQIRAAIDEAHAGPFRVTNLRAQWDATGRKAVQVTGTASGRVEDALAWLSAHEQLQVHAPHVRGIDAQGNARVDFTVAIPEERRGRNGVASERPARVRLVTALEDVQVQLTPGVAPLTALEGVLAFEGGELQQSTLTASWLGGPLTLQVSERRDGDVAALVMSAQGLFEAQRLAALTGFGDGSEIEGQSTWKGEIVYRPDATGNTPRWQVRAESALLGVSSRLPEPLSKPAGMLAPLRIELAGLDDSAIARVEAPSRLRGVFDLQRVEQGWHLARGTMRLGAGAAVALPEEAVLDVRGQLGRLDLHAYLDWWRRGIGDPAWPALRGELSTDELVIAGRSYADVTLLARRDANGSELSLESAALSGVVRWSDQPQPDSPVEVSLATLSLPEPTQPGETLEGFDSLLALWPAAQVSIDRVVWRGQPLGRLTATVASGEQSLRVEELRLANDAYDAQGSLQCESSWASCRIRFDLNSRNVAATLRTFGFREDMSAAQASLEGTIDWVPRAEGSWLATAQGPLKLRLTEGTTRLGAAPTGQPFALFVMPALVEAAQRAAQEKASTSQQPAGMAQELKFALLEGDYELRDGAAATSNLHLDGDAEILVRGRTGLLTRDYAHTLWVLRGEDRLPEALRRFGASARMAAAWLALRDLFTSDEGRARSVLKLSGSWEAPVVAVESR